MSNFEERCNELVNEIDTMLNHPHRLTPEEMAIANAVPQQPHPLRRSSDVSPDMIRKVSLNETYGKLGHASDDPLDLNSIAQRRAKYWPKNSIEFKTLYPDHPNVSPTSAPATPSPKPWSPSDLKHGDMVQIAAVENNPSLKSLPYFFIGLSSSRQSAVLEQRMGGGERVPFSVHISKIIPPAPPEKKVTMVAVCFGDKIDMYPRTDFKGPDKTARKITSAKLRPDGMLDVTYSEEPIDWDNADRLKIPVL